MLVVYAKHFLSANAMETDSQLRGENGTLRMHSMANPRYCCIHIARHFYFFPLPLLVRIYLLNVSTFSNAIAIAFAETIAIHVLAHTGTQRKY